MTNKDILNIVNNNQKKIFNNQIFSIANSKLKKDNIGSFDITQGSTCPYAGSCLKFCYAAKTKRLYKNARLKYESNFELSKTSDFVQVACDSLKALPGVNIFRIHSSGDFYSKEYLNKWIEIANLNPEKIFYCYTKSIVFFSGLDLPSNFLMIQSEGTINDSKFLNYTKPFARIFDNIQDLQQAVDGGNFIDSSHSDLNTIKAILSGKNVALLKH